MDDKTWLESATVIVIVTVPLLAGAGYLIRDQLRARRNLQYKTLTDHAILNSSDRETWMSGILPREGKAIVERFSGLALPVAQIVTVLVLALIVLWSNSAIMSRMDSQEKRLAMLELQLHALAFAAPSPGGSSSDTAPPGPQTSIPVTTGPVTTGTPMQQVCANLIGRVADAYEKGESSKIGESLEELVNKLGCQKHLQP
jgi:hypothetical protein